MAKLAKVAETGVTMPVITDLTRMTVQHYFDFFYTDDRPLYLLVGDELYQIENIQHHTIGTTYIGGGYDVLLEGEQDYRYIDKYDDVYLDERAVVPSPDEVPKDDAMRITPIWVFDFKTKLDKKELIKITRSAPIAEAMSQISKRIVSGPLDIDWSDRYGFCQMTFQQLLEFTNDWTAAAAIAMSDDNDAEQDCND